MAETNKKSFIKPVQSSNWYQKWHNDYNRHAFVHWAILAIIVVCAWALLYRQIIDWVITLNEPGVSLQLAKPSAALVLDPQIKSVTVGEDLAINIILDTASSNVDGVDIYSLHYDPTILRVVDDVPSQAGVQIKPGIIMALNAANSVDAKIGAIKFGQVSAGGSSYHGRGVLATIHFKAISSGTAYLKFDFSRGSTVDSNAAFRGKDQLGKVVDGIYTVYAAQK